MVTYSVSQDGLDFIKQYQTGPGLERGQPALTAYDDGKGVWIIGWGHTAGVEPGDTITIREAEQFLATDINVVVQSSLNEIAAAHAAAGFEMTQPQVDAVASLIFNLGPTKVKFRVDDDGNILQDSDGNNVQTNTWNALLSGDFDRYLIEMSEFRDFGESTQAGLENRRADEAQMFTQGDYEREFGDEGFPTGAEGNPYAPGNYGDRENPTFIPQEWVVGDQNQECFPSGTLITLTDGTTKPIEAITQSDIVLTHDANGNPVPGKVTKLFTNTTSEFVRLTFTDGRNDLVATPGHRFLTETGDYMELGHMLRLGGGSMRVVDTDGSIVEAAGEVIAYSAETAHMFPEAQTKTIAFEGNTVLKEEVEQGWQTYNFEVQTHHNYVAGGVRVHNDSILSTLEEGDTLIALNDDLTDAAVLRDVNGDGVDDFVTLDGFRRDGEATAIALERVYLNTTGTDYAAVLDSVLQNNAPDGTNASENVFDPGNGNNWNDGTWGDDIEEAFFDDVVGASGNGTDRATINGLYSATYFSGVDISSLSSAGDIVASQDLIDVISDAATSPDDAASIAAWLLGIDEGTTAFTIFIAALGSIFDDVTSDLILDGTGGADSLVGDSGNDIITGFSGNDVIEGGNGADQIFGGNDNDNLSGGFGDDFIFGGAGDDVLAGNGGADTLDGGAGDDWLNGGWGYDDLIGGTGADSFYHHGVQNGFGTEWIHDFSDTEGDRLITQANGTVDDFVVNFATTNGRGSDDIAEAFIRYVPTGQIAWVLQDGADLDEITIQTANGTFDLL